MKVKQYAVIGLGRIGSSLATTLYSLGQEVLAVDINEEKIDDIANYVTHAVQCDATDEQAMKSLGLGNLDVAVVTIGKDIQASILACLLCKELGVKTIIGKAQTEQHGRVLQKIGLDKVIFPERDAGMRMAHGLVSATILDYFELSPDHSLVEINAPAFWKGKSLEESAIRSHHSLTIMAIKRGDNINLTPRGSDKILDNDILVIVGHNDDVRKLEEKLRK